MWMAKISDTIAACIITMLLSVNISHAQTPSPTTAPNPILEGKSQEQVFTLQQIIGTPGFTLRGASNSRYFYLPVMQQWNLASIKLHLLLYHVALTANKISLTLSINDNPISSINLEGLADVSTPWDVDLPLALLKGNTINLRIDSSVADYGFQCYNLFNPGFWIYIASNSTITYRYALQNYKPDLTKFPSPFVNDPSVEKDNIVIALPDSPSIENLNALFYLAGALSMRSTWRGINLIPTTISALTPEQKNTANIIFIGTGPELNINNLGIHWPLKVDTTGKFTGSDNKVLPDGTGIIMLAQSWNPQHALLALSGNSASAVIKAALMLRNPNFVNTTLFNEYALVTNVDEIIFPELIWRDITFEDLGFKNQMVYGNGDNSLTYTIELPMNKTTEKVILDLNYSVSPFISYTQKSFLSFKINSLPVGGTTVEAAQGVQHWRFEIDGESLKPGKNQLAFSFHLKLRNRDCTPQDLTLAWATIYASSGLHAEYNDSQPFLTLDSFIAANNDLIILLDKNLQLSNDKAFQNQIINLGTRMSNTKNVSIATATDTNTELMRKSNIVYVGKIDDDSTLNAYRDRLPFNYVGQSLKISKVLLPYVTISDETPVALIQVIRSPFNASRLLFALSALNTKGYQLAFNILTDPKKYELINGNVVLIYDNGTFTSIQSERLLVKAKNQARIDSLGHRLYMLAIIGIALIIAIVILMYIVRRLRRYFGVNKP